MSREERLQKAFKLGNEMIKNYTREKYCELLELCSDDIFYSEGSDNDFYIEDEHFIYE